MSGSTGPAAHARRNLGRWLGVNGAILLAVLVGYFGVIWLIPFGPLSEDSLSSRFDSSFGSLLTWVAAMWPLAIAYLLVLWRVARRLRTVREQRRMAVLLSPMLGGLLYAAVILEWDEVPHLVAAMDIAIPILLYGFLVRVPASHRRRERAAKDDVRTYGFDEP
jgi:hypothetical protein